MSKQSNAEKYKLAKKGKPPVVLVDPDFVDGMAHVLDFGNAKHGHMNWQQGVPISEVVSAVKRHIAAIERGEHLDPETGRPHTCHAASGLMYIEWYHRVGMYDQLNDLPYHNTAIVRKARHG